MICHNFSLCVCSMLVIFCESLRSFCFLATAVPPKRVLSCIFLVEGHSRGHFISFNVLGRHSKWYFITFCPVKKLWRRHFFVLDLLGKQPRGHILSFNRASKSAFHHVLSTIGESKKILLQCFWASRHCGVIAHSECSARITIFWLQLRYRHEPENKYLSKQLFFKVLLSSAVFPPFIPPSAAVHHISPCSPFSSSSFLSTYSSPLSCISSLFTQAAKSISWWKQCAKTPLNRWSLQLSWQPTVSHKRQWNDIMCLAVAELWKEAHTVLRERERATRGEPVKEKGRDEGWEKLTSRGGDRKIRRGRKRC